MTALYIIGALLLALFGISRVHLGVRFHFGQSLCVYLKAGPWKIQLVPKCEKPKKAKKTGKKKQKKPPRPAAGHAANRPKPTFADIRSAMPAVWESLGRALRQSGRRVRIDPMQLSVTFGGDDPAAAAELYGWACSAMWAVMPRLERLVQLPDPQLHLGVDFDAPRTVAEGTVEVRFCVGDFPIIGFAAAAPLLKWFRAYRRTKKQEKAAQTAPPERNEKIA